MAGKKDLFDLVRECATKRIIFLPHALRQMSRPDRMISTKDIRLVIENGEVIEDYPKDARGHSCLIFGIVIDRPVHVVCAPKEEYLAIITAYEPSHEDWEDNFKKRKNHEMHVLSGKNEQVRRAVSC